MNWLKSGFLKMAFWHSKKSTNWRTFLTRKTPAFGGGFYLTVCIRCYLFRPLAKSLFFPILNSQSGNWSRAPCFSQIRSANFKRLFPSRGYRTSCSWKTYLIPHLYITCIGLTLGAPTNVFITAPPSSRLTRSRYLYIQHLGIARPGKIYYFTGVSAISQ